MNHISKILKVLHHWKSYYVVSAILLLLSTIFRMIEPKILQVAIDGAIGFYQSNGEKAPEAKDSITQTIYALLPSFSLDNLLWIMAYLGIIYVVVALIRGVTMFGSSAITAFATERSVKRLRDNLFAHLQALPLTFHAKNSTGEVIQRCTGDVDTVKGFIGGEIVEIVRMSAIFFTAFFMIYIVHPTYAFTAVCLVPLIFLASVFFFKKERKIWDKHESEQDKLTSIVEENLAGIRVVQAFAQGDKEREKFNDQNEKKLDIGMQHLKLHAIYWPLSDGIFHLQITLSILAGAYFTLNGSLTVGELVACYTYIIMVSWPMRRIGQVISKMGMTFVAIERLSNILDIPTENDEGIKELDNPIQGAIEFKNVWFKYPETEEQIKKKESNDFVLKGVSFTVAAGDTVALMGATGSGKSTLIALLARFYEPSKGEIFLDGLPLTDYSKAFLREKVGIVLQKAFLFSTTIKNNIAYTNPDIEEAQIVEAAQAASIHEIMHIFPKGYDTLVGEKGVTLSGGQKQRVALARTLMESPDILVLDDATSAVDTETEYQIQQAIEQRLDNKTTFLIAHRMTTIQPANKIIVLEKGEVVQMGIHQSLRNEEGFYQKVYRVQAAIEDDILI